MSKWIERLYVIGAGASAAAPYRLPTLKALTWELARTFSKSNRRLFERAVYECFGVRLGRKQYVDFEERCSIVSIPARSRPGHAQAMKAIWAAFFEVMQSARELVVIG